MNHAYESVGYFAFGSGEFYAAESKSSSRLAAVANREVGFNQAIPLAASEFVRVVTESTRVDQLTHTLQSPIEFALAGSIENIDFESKDRLFASDVASFEFVETEISVLDDGDSATDGLEKKLAVLR